MIYVPDSNLLIRAEQVGHPDQLVAKNAVDAILQKQHTFCLLPQTLYEFWNVCTRPLKYNGLGKTPTEVEQMLLQYERGFVVLHDSQAVYHEWPHLVRLHSVSGVQVHDARIAAAVRVHGVACLVTFNGDDFKRYGINVVHPASV